MESRQTTASNELVEFQSQSLEEACAFISRIFCPHELKGTSARRQAAQVVMRHTPLGDTSLNYLGHGVPVDISPQCFEKFYLFQATLTGTTTIRKHGRSFEVPQGQASMTAPDEAYSMWWGEGCTQLIFRVDRGALESMFTSMYGIMPTRPLHFADTTDLRSGTMGSAWQMMQLIYSDMSHNAHSSFQDEFVTKHVEQAILYGLLQSHEHLYRDALKWQTREIAPQQVRRVEDYINANAGDPITIDDLVAVSGVAARTLFDNFKKFRGMTPMRYLQQVRLLRVRERLSAPCNGDTVTSIAMEWGFSQLGRFAVTYKSAFGESPSQTLARARSKQ